VKDQSSERDAVPKVELESERYRKRRGSSRAVGESPNEALADPALWIRFAVAAGGCKDPHEDAP
jgi:hypothetical protein